MEYDPIPSPDASANPAPIDRKVEPLEPPSRRRLKLLGFYPAATAVVALLTGIVVAASIDQPQVDDLEHFVPRLVTQLYDHSGQVYQKYSRENRILLEEGELPELVQQAILATEDANFYNHGGVDLKSVIRAAVVNFREGRTAEGASTITMQLARDLFSLTREKDYKRKVEEALLAVEIEKRYSKQQILTMYANMVNLGHGNYGMEAAARNYFNKSVAELSLVEAATLAGLPQRPSDYSVYRRPERVVWRRNVVLGRMLDEGYITREEFEAARKEPLLVVERRRQQRVGPYFAEEVRRFLLDTYGATELYDRGLQVYTTLDRDVQRAAELALREGLVEIDHGRGWRGPKDRLESEDLEALELPSWPSGDPIPGEWYEGIVLESGRQKATVRIGEQTYELGEKGIEWTRKTRPDRLLERGDVAWFRLEPAEKEDDPPVLHLEQEPEMEAAVVVIESATGAVRAMVGGWSFERNEFNRVTQARRQVGSAFKPFVYGAALENGFTAADTLFDGPVVFPTGPGQPPYSPRNFYRRYDGIVTLREALEDSINVTAVKLLDIVGIEQVISFARRCGIDSELPPYASLALGTAELTPLELAGAYATFPNRGIFVEPYMVERVDNRNGRTLQDHLPRARKATTPQNAFVLTSMLRGVALRGTAARRLSKLEIETAGKTGTTDSFTDAWFAGFTPRYTILAWVGYDQKRFLGRGMTGAQAALPIWVRVVRRGLEDGWLSPDEKFTAPPGIVEVEVEARTGLLASPYASRTIREHFVEGSEPDKYFDGRWAGIVSLPWYLQEPFYLPKEGERMPGHIRSWRTVEESWGGQDATGR